METAPMDDFSGEVEEESWCSSQRDVVAEYLRVAGVNHGCIGIWPAWHITKCVAIWAIESAVRPEWIGWWVISGDLPTDYCSSGDIEPPQHPRKALRVFAERWLELLDAWRRGEGPTDFSIGLPELQHELAPLIQARAEIFLEWVADDSLWEDE